MFGMGAWLHWLAQQTWRLLVVTQRACRTKAAAGQDCMLQVGCHTHPLVTLVGHLQGGAESKGEVKSWEHT